MLLHHSTLVTHMLATCKQPVMPTHHSPIQSKDAHFCPRINIAAPGELAALHQSVSEAGLTQQAAAGACKTACTQTKSQQASQMRQQQAHARLQGCKRQGLMMHACPNRNGSPEQKCLESHSCCDSLGTPKAFKTSWVQQHLRPVSGDRTGGTERMFQSRIVAVGCRG